MPHVDGVDDGVGYGVFGRSNIGGDGVIGLGSGGRRGVYGFSGSGDGVFGQSDSNTKAGVHGRNFTHMPGGDAVFGESLEGVGVAGRSDTYIGVRGESEHSIGVEGTSFLGIGVAGYSEHYALYGNSLTGYAAYLIGKVRVTGHLYKDGGGFEIDHPLDPANKYLHHSFVESPDMKNVYDGVVALDDKGEADIELPDWFGILNKDFRYQLTAIGAPGPNLYIAEEISDTTTKHGSDGGDSGDNNNGNRFKIAGGNSGMKVSWQVTGIRRDPWANANRIQV